MVGRVRLNCELFGGRFSSKQGACRSRIAPYEPPPIGMEALSFLQCGFSAPPAAGDRLCILSTPRSKEGKTGVAVSPVLLRSTGSATAETLWHLTCKRHC